MCTTSLSLKGASSVTSLQNSFHWFYEHSNLVMNAAVEKHTKHGIWFSAHLSLETPEFDGTVISKRDVELKPMMPGEKVTTIHSVPVLSFSPLTLSLC